MKCEKLDVSGLLREVAIDKKPSLSVEEFYKVRKIEFSVSPRDFVLKNVAGTVVTSITQDPPKQTTHLCI